MKEAINQRQPVEVAGVLKISEHALGAEHNLCAAQQKALAAITRCRARDAGGHVSYCNKCGHKEQSYNSGRDRHCPKCQYIKQEQWVDKLKSRLMPGRYFHVVFTIPHQLNTVFYINQGKCYHILFASAWEALKRAGNNSGYLGAEVGALAVLHTWGQTLSYHPPCPHAGSRGRAFRRRHGMGPFPTFVLRPGKGTISHVPGDPNEAIERAY